MTVRGLRAAACAALLVAAGASYAPANAADISKPEAYTPPPRFNPPPPPGREVRSGWYLGGLLGYGLANTDVQAGGNFEFDTDGAILGGLVGWNYINGRGLIGLEADLVAGDTDGSLVFGANAVDASLDWMAGARVRAGYFATPQLLLFAMIGAAWADFDLPVTGPGGGPGSETFAGIQFGGGAEMALSERWSARFDYLYTNFSAETVTYPGGAAVEYDPDVHQFRAGLVLRF